MIKLDWNELLWNTDLGAITKNVCSVLMKNNNYCLYENVM